MSRFIYWISLTISIAFLALPLLLVLPLAFNDSSFLTYPMEGFTFDWFYHVYQEAIWSKALLNSLVVALGAMIVATLIGGMAAIGVLLTGRLAQVILTALFVSPLVLPSIVIGVAFAYSFGRMMIAGSYTSIILAHAILGAPLVFLSVMTSLKLLNPDLDRAAASLGASRTHRFWRITLPLTAPGFIAGAIFAFITSFDEVVVALFLVSPDTTTLPIALFASLRDRLQPTIVVVALLLSIVSFLFLLFLNWAQKNSKTAK
ncbi:ABC transporter permease [Pseudochrobactrum asaccharolyticum]|uniref:Putative spermidine/putrescine transport system permease protein n=1 Tax=Pseudochrobactrum asaccharolyticum TaxID=354351 RepID=A0A366DM35_9HYPH|nr:ABC transporter permease [Pseudochrobactrum asaccharolyticum]RBO91153.1 putative spermidine/putrescine transport system permease protein [Pseudochrobactrum asaccharolyticum]